MPRRPNTLSPERMKQLARAGAEKVLNELRADIIAIERTFPELALPRKRQAVAKTLRRVGQRGSKMSAAARKAISERMRKYWAERRRAKAKLK